MKRALFDYSPLKAEEVTLNVTGQISTENDAAPHIKALKHFIDIYKVIIRPGSKTYETTIVHNQIYRIETPRARLN